MSPSVVRDTWGFICVQEIHRGTTGNIYIHRLKMPKCSNLVWARQ